MQIRNILTQPITLEGVGIFKLLMSSFELREMVYLNNEDWKVSSSNSPDWLFYEYKESIKLTINVHVGALVSVTLKNNYQGLLFEEYGINTKVEKLMKNKTLTFDEEYLLFDEHNFDILFKIKGVEDINDIESIKHNLISEIIIRSSDYCGLPVVEKEMPEEWKALRKKI